MTTRATDCLHNYWVICQGRSRVGLACVKSNTMWCLSGGRTWASGPSSPMPRSISFKFIVPSKNGVVPISLLHIDPLTCFNNICVIYVLCCCSSLFFVFLQMLYDCMTLRACFNLFILTNIDRCRPYFLHGLRLKVLPSSKVRNGTQQTQQSSSVTHSSPLGLEDEIADLVCLHTLCLHLC